jgi:hypothetical protein
MSNSTTEVSASTNPRVFAPNEDGSGAFGRWIIDQAGLPAYRYEFAQYHDDRAAFPITAGAERRDHWHQIGNDRITALAANDGTVQVYLCDRGGVFLNRFEAHTASTDLLSKALDAAETDDLYSVKRVDELRAAQQPELADYVTQLHQPDAEPSKGPLPDLSHELRPHAYAGGFSYLADGTGVWATAYRYCPAGAETQRIFGVGYLETTTTYRDIRTIRRVYAPHGDEAVLLIDVEIQNQRLTPVELCHYEYWDVNRYQLELQWLRTGVLPTRLGDLKRYAINDEFTPSTKYDDQSRALRFHQEPSSLMAQPPDEINTIDWSPADIFLADLGETPPAKHYTNRAAFFGEGGPGEPSRRQEPATAPDDAMPYCLVLRHDVHLEPQATVRLRLAYGAVPPDQSLQFLEHYRGQPSWPDTLEQWKSQLAYFTTGNPGESFLQREMAWHAYNLLSATVYHAYYETHFVPQGSAYLYLHGADGAPRDQGLCVIPLTYVRPQLARDTLRLIMHLTHADSGAIPYAFGGYGVHDGAIVHTDPSDLDLFFLLGMSEYLAATGDMAFLNCDEPFYPRGAAPTSVSGSTVLDHIRMAVRHLTQTIGIGEHGLLKIGDGDWSDSIVLETALKDPLHVSFANSKANGESVPNTQMALYVLPLMAAVVEARDPALAAELRDFAEKLTAGANGQWSGQGNWYTRAVLRGHLNNPVVQDARHINLEAQPWALISRLAAKTGREDDLIASITKLLDDPSPIGATLREHGMVWPAVSQLLTWGYTRSRQDLAWRSLQRHTFAAHARAFPDVWINIWSGPDGINGLDADNPGGTWNSPLTPMTDFPVMNANQDAMALLGLLRVCGIEPAPSGDGLLIAPKSPPERFVLDLPLLRLDVAPGRIAGEYRAFVAGSRVLHVRVPSKATSLFATVRGQIIKAFQIDELGVALPLDFQAGEHVLFEVCWAE